VAIAADQRSGVVPLGRIAWLALACRWFRLGKERLRVAPYQPKARMLLWFSHLSVRNSLVRRMKNGPLQRVKLRRVK
jgi:hypothetical protein